MPAVRLDVRDRRSPQASSLAEFPQEGPAHNRLSFHRLPNFWIVLSAVAWLTAQPSPALAQAVVWEPQLTHIQGLTELRRFFYSARRGTVVAIHGTRLMPVVLDKDERGREVRVALDLIEIGVGPTAWFEGRAGGLLIFREFVVRIGDANLRLDGGEAVWTDTIIIGRMPAGVPTGEHPVTIMVAGRDGYTSAGIRSSELRVRVIAADEDGDGHEKTAVDDGDDCDDNDPRRYPGALEVADFDGYDEDCNTETIGRLDRDADRHIDSRVCNWISSTEARCGDDCDDERSRVYPGEIETCDDLDNDCNELVDDNLISCKSSLAGTRRPIPQPTDANRPAPEIVFTPAGTVVTTFPAIDGCKCK
jgi:hypothetical protein